MSLNFVLVSDSPLCFLCVNRFSVMELQRHWEEVTNSMAFVKLSSVNICTRWMRMYKNRVNHFISCVNIYALGTKLLSN